MDFNTVLVPSAATPVTNHYKGGLVSGTGRLRDMEVRRQAQAAAAPNNKQRLVTDNGLIPLYCSDTYHFAEINDRATDKPRKEQLVPVARQSFTGSTSTASSSLSTPQKHMSSIEKFALAYNFPIPPPAPTYKQAFSSNYSTHQYNNGVMMAAKLISELCPTKPAPSAQAGRYSSCLPEPTVIPGWNDGSSDWRAAVYNFTSASSQNGLLSRSQTVPTPSNRRRITFPSKSSGAPPPHPSTLDSSELIADFNAKLTKRSESRMRPTSACASPNRERSIIASSVQGKLLVPDVKLKVHTGTSSSPLSMPSRTPSRPPAITGATASGSNSRTSIRNPLATSLSDHDERYSTSFTLRHPTIETRPWSYANVLTYPILQLPLTKITRVERRMVDDKECDVEVEVEAREERNIKPLFLFAPKTVCRI